MSKPDKLAEVDRLRLYSLSLEFELIKARLEKAAKAFEDEKDRVMKQYEIGNGDGVDINTGAITRAPVAEPAAETKTE